MKLRFAAWRLRIVACGLGLGLTVACAWGDAVVDRIAALRARGFPIVDYHAHLKGGLTLEALLEHGRATGISYGVAANCGRGFPITDDVAALAHLEKMHGRPVLTGMQAEGREWVTMFSPGVVARFDYVFTDALTFVDAGGRRVRLWVADEVEIGDADEFMERYVAVIVGILEREPVDIYVNPTVLPGVLKERYDALWTAARRARVIDALARSGVALEINARHRLPKLDFLRAARARGVKFAFGTNNSDCALGRLEYCLEMVDACGLVPSDMFVPRATGHKPVQVRGFR